MLYYGTYCASVDALNVTDLAYYVHLQLADIHSSNHR